VNIGKIFSAIFEDPQWVSKLAITAVITLVSGALSVVLIGIAGFAVLAGYQVAIMNNVRAGVQFPLPKWDDISEYFSTGWQVLVAGLVYGLPVLFFGCIISGIAAVGGDSDAVALFAGSLSCLLIPVMLLYFVVIGPMFTLGMGRFADDPRMSVFFQFGELFGLVRQNMSLVMNFIIGLLIVGVIMGALGSIPCIGWIAAAGLGVPVQAILGGQFVAAVLGSGKAKRELLA
jgi:hypothetical protein